MLLCYPNYWVTPVTEEGVTQMKFLNSSANVLWLIRWNLYLTDLLVPVIPSLPAIYSLRNEDPNITYKICWCHGELNIKLKGEFQASTVKRRFCSFLLLAKVLVFPYSSVRSTLRSFPPQTARTSEEITVVRWCGLFRYGIKLTAYGSFPTHGRYE